MACRPRKVGSRTPHCSTARPSEGRARGPAGRSIRRGARPRNGAAQSRGAGHQGAPDAVAAQPSTHRVGSPRRRAYGAAQTRSQGRGPWWRGRSAWARCNPVTGARIGPARTGPVRQYPDSRAWYYRQLPAAAVVEPRGKPPQRMPPPWPPAIDVSGNRWSPVLIRSRRHRGAFRQPLPLIDGSITTTDVAAVRAVAGGRR
jgi:hypothetical protein